MAEKNIDQIRHTLSHLTVAAVRELWPGSQNAIGPAIDNGFYQDFEIVEIKGVMKKAFKLNKSYTATNYFMILRNAKS